MMLETRQWLQQKRQKKAVHFEHLPSRTNFDGTITALIYPIYNNESDEPNMVQFYMKYDRTII